MQLHSSYWMQAEWGSRDDPPSDIADRFLRTIDGLHALDPLLDGWSWGDYYELEESEHERGVYRLDDIRPNMSERVARNMGNGGRDGPEPDPYYGYKLMSQTEHTPPGSRIDLGGSAGARPGRPGLGVTPFTNRMSFDVGSTPDPSLMRYALWRDVMLLLAETWEATWVEAAPHDMSEHWGTTRAFRACWMCCVSPRNASVVTPPSGIIAERRPNGGLFMAATDAMFQTANSQHLAGARAIELALAPLNRLDYPIDEPYR